MLFCVRHFSAFCLLFRDPGNLPVFSPPGIITAAVLDSATGPRNGHPLAPSTHGGGPDPVQKPNAGFLSKISRSETESQILIRISLLCSMKNFCF